MDLNNLSPELQEKLKACTTQEELEALVAKEGLELSADELAAISGGIQLEGCTTILYDEKDVRGSGCRMIFPCRNQLFEEGEEQLEKLKCWNRDA